MSTKKSKTATTGVRYSDEQKREIVEFVEQYNANNGRGGQSAASTKYKVTPLTISGWIKSLGASKPKKKAAAVEKAEPAAKTSPVVKASKAGNKSKKGIRYTAEQKQEVIDYVTSYNAANGRGGQSHAANKYGLSVLTVSSWLKSGGVSSRAAKGSAPVPAGLATKVSAFIEVAEEIRQAEAALQSLRAKYNTLKSSIQASL